MKKVDFLYYMISINASHKMYLYKSKDMYEVGEYVWVFAYEGALREGVICQSYKRNPLPEYAENRIKEISGKNKNIIKHKDVQRYFLQFIKYFKDVEITRKTFTDAWKILVFNNKLKVRKRTKLYDIIWNELPDIDLYCVLEPGNEEEQEFEFRKAIIRWEYLIKYGCTREELYERTVLARIMSERHDPVEDSEKYMRVELDVERKVKKEIGEGGYMGYCHLYWSVKKEY